MIMLQHSPQLHQRSSLYGAFRMPVTMQGPPGSWLSTAQVYQMKGIVCIKPPVMHDGILCCRPKTAKRKQRASDQAQASIHAALPDIPVKGALDI